MPDSPAALEAVTDEALARRIAAGRPGSADAEEAEIRSTRSATRHGLSTTLVSRVVRCARSDIGQ
jgi:hypothetical protein